MFSCMGMMAQVKVGKYKDWKKTIDLLEVKASYDFTGRKTVILLPVETKDVKLPAKGVRELSEDLAKMILGL